MPLALRIGDPGERSEELLFGVLHREVAHAPHEIGFAFPHQAGIHVDAAHPIRPQRPRAERERHARIHPAGDEEEHAALAHALADFLLQHGRAMPHVPVLPASSNPKREVGQILLAARGVDHFQVELHRVEPALWRRHGRHRACAGAPRHREPFRHPPHHIAMAHPDLLRAGQSAEHRVRRIVQFQRGQAVFALHALADFPAQ